MHICLIAPNRFHHDHKSLTTRQVLLDAGHEISVVAVEEKPASGLVNTTVPNNFPAGLGRLGGILRRVQPRSWRDAGITRRLTAAAIDTGATSFMPTHPKALQSAIRAARGTGGMVLRTPEMSCPPEFDVIRLTPSRPDLAAPVAGGGVFHTPGDTRDPYTPEPGRLEGRKVIICYRKTDSNPGKYLESALRRSGAQVRLETEGIDLDEVDPTTDAVVFVEGPYPALDVVGTTDVPTLFWTHHGEHHIYTNVRLANRYRADAVLLAHSWHLAHWFPAPVHRFPFGIATELLDPGMPLQDRPFDVALVGAKLRTGGPYGRRQQIVDELEAAFPPERLSFGEKVSAAVMADMYANARIVVNEGGTRHYPITMRVLEAVGSGAVLLSDLLPGTEMILEPESEFAILGDDVVSDVNHLLGDIDHMQRMADRALARSLGINTYDHRVDEIMEIAGTIEKRTIPENPAVQPLAAAIDSDAEIQRLVHIGAPDLVGQLKTREIWEASEIRPERLSPGNIDAVAVRGPAEADQLETVLRSARRYIFSDGPVDGLDDFVEREHPQAQLSSQDSVRRFDLMAEAYRIMPHEVVGE